jgi:outer membrane protein assembly factor BamD (BamD/ComL family)
MVFGLTFGVLALATGSLSFWLVVIALAAALATSGASLLLGRLAGDGWTAMTISGSSTPYEEQYSYQESLVMQGRVDEALDSFETIIAASRHAVEPRIKAAELYRQRKDGAARAAELLREAQRITSIPPGRDVYATYQLVDLLVGPLGNPGRAVVELRRLIDRYPKSAAAGHARQALTRIKSGLHDED